MVLYLTKIFLIFHSFPIVTFYVRVFLGPPRHAFVGCRRRYLGAEPPGRGLRPISRLLSNVGPKSRYRSLNYSPKSHHGHARNLGLGAATWTPSLAPQSPSVWAPRSETKPCAEGLFSISRSGSKSDPDLKGEGTCRVPPSVSEAGHERRVCKLFCR